MVCGWVGEQGLGDGCSNFKIYLGKAFIWAIVDEGSNKDQQVLDLFMVMGIQNPK